MISDHFDQVKSMKRYNILLKGVKTKEELESVCRMLYQKLSRRNINQFNVLILEAICSFILTKILVVGMGPEAVKLVEIMLEMELMPVIYHEEFHRLLSDQLDLLYGIKRELNRDVTRYAKNIEKQFRANISLLLKTDANSDTIITKTIGYSFFTVTGNLIWSDSNTHKLLEIKNQAPNSVNLFKLMIPFSVNYLNMRFGNELFKKNMIIGSQICFSFVIYSKQALNKYFKQLKKKKVDKIADLQEEEDNKSLYFKFLKALSCRATLVALKSSKDDIRCLENSVMSVDQGKVTPQKKITEIGPVTIETAKGLSDNQDDETINLAVMLEMRISKSIPNFNYKSMDNDSKITEFREFVKKRLEVNE